MKRKNSFLVTKIALIVAIIALVFSIVTLVRAIIIQFGIPLAVVQVIGTAIIVAVCAIMLYVLNTNADEDIEEEYAEGPPAPEAPEAAEPEEYAEYDFSDDPIEAPIEAPIEVPSEPADVPPAPTSSRYDLSNFE